MLVRQGDSETRELKKALEAVALKQPRSCFYWSKLTEIVPDAFKVHVGEVPLDRALSGLCLFPLVFRETLLFLVRL